MSQPLIMIVGIDPEVHELPPLLVHHLKKMQKDFPVAFLANPDNQDELEGIKKALEATKFTPVLKKKAKQPKPTILGLNGQELN